ncbi:MAG: helix-turn-helix domain-containing protein [Patescibacteria group bacterium]|jgi:excisionase family DNA binding protein
MIGSHANKKLINTAELAEYLRLSKTSVYRLIEKRSIRFYKAGGHILFDIYDVDEYLKNRCVEPIERKYGNI